jgi:hypothetical protein
MLVICFDHYLDLADALTSSTPFSASTPRSARPTSTSFSSSRSRSQAGAPPGQTRYNGKDDDRAADHLLLAGVQTGQDQAVVLRAGIIGTGFMGGVHAAAVRAAGHMISSVAGSTPAAGADGAARLGGRRAAASAAELIASADVDVVHVCTPNLTHAELAVSFLAGRDG